MAAGLLGAGAIALAGAPTVDARTTYRVFDDSHDLVLGAFGSRPLAVWKDEGGQLRVGSQPSIEDTTVLPSTVFDSVTENDSWGTKAVYDAGAGLFLVVWAKDDTTREGFDHLRVAWVSPSGRVITTREVTDPAIRRDLGGGAAVGPLPPISCLGDGRCLILAPTVLSDQATGLLIDGRRLDAPMVGVRPRLQMDRISDLTCGRSRCLGVGVRQPGAGPLARTVVQVLAPAGRIPTKPRVLWPKYSPSDISVSYNRYLDRFLLAWEESAESRSRRFRHRMAVLRPDGRFLRDRIAFPLDERFTLPATDRRGPIDLSTGGSRRGWLAVGPDGFGRMVTPAGRVGSPQALPIGPDWSWPRDYPAFTLSPQGAVEAYVSGSRSALVRFPAIPTTGDGVPPPVYANADNDQHLLRQGNVRVTVGCGERCNGTVTVSVAGNPCSDGVKCPENLGLVSKTLDPSGRRQTMTVALPPPLMAAIKQAADADRFIYVSVTVAARDRAGNLGIGRAYVQAAKMTPCDAIKGRALASNPQVRVVASAEPTSDPSPFWNLRIYACQPGTDRNVLLEAFDSTGADPFVALGGAVNGTLAIGYANAPPAGSETMVGDGHGGEFFALPVVDMASGRIVRSVELGEDESIADGALVLADNAAVAFIEAGTRRFPQPMPPQVIAQDALGRRVLASGPGIDTSSLRLGGRVISWIQDGATRTETLQ